MPDSLGVSIHGASTERAVTEDTSPDEVRDLRRDLRLVENRMAAFQAAAIDRERARVAKEPGVLSEDGRSPEEVGNEARRAMFRKLDDLLRTDPGAPTRSAETALGGEVSQGLGAIGRVAAVACASEFCRVEIESEEAENSNVQPQLVTLPGLRHEAVYDYKQEGTRKRTIVYVAREGHMLPLPRAASPEPGSCP